MKTASNLRSTDATRQLELPMRLFSMLDDITLGELPNAMDTLAVELNREVAQAANHRVRRDAITYWREASSRNSGCAATVENLAFLERHEHLAPNLRAGVDS